MKEKLFFFSLKHPLLYFVAGDRLKDSCGDIY